MLFALSSVFKIYELLSFVQNCKFTIVPGDAPLNSRIPSPCSPNWKKPSLLTICISPLFININSFSSARPIPPEMPIFVVFLSCTAHWIACTEFKFELNREFTLFVFKANSYINYGKFNLVFPWIELNAALSGFKTPEGLVWDREFG